MNISLKGQDIIKNEIKKRLTRDNIYRIAKILSSNRCENYFGCLVKYSKGKILNVDATNTWHVHQAFVAGLRSNSNFTSDLMEELKLGNNLI